MEKLSKDASEARRTYLREWKKQHKDKVSEYNRRYWENRVKKSKEHEELERHCRNVIAKMGDQLHKEGSRYWIEFDISHCIGHSEFTQRPADEDYYRWNTLEEIADYCARMEER